MIKKISPSIMCADMLDLERCIAELEESGAELVHVDITDGRFVPNYTLGTDFVKALKKRTKIPLDIHLMIENPESKINWFDFGENDYVSVHCESTAHLCKAIEAVKARGAKAMAAINPATPMNAVECVAESVDGVLVMTVNPGFAGQKLIKPTLKKVRALRDFLDNSGCGNVEIEVDGNVSFENAVLMRDAGANIFVAGTSSVFKSDSTIAENMRRFRNVLNG